jgi:hypothetical protein
MLTLTEKKNCPQKKKKKKIVFLHFAPTISIKLKISPTTFCFVTEWLPIMLVSVILVGYGGR